MWRSGELSGWPQNDDDDDGDDDDDDDDDEYGDDDDDDDEDDADDDDDDDEEEDDDDDDGDDVDDDDYYDYFLSVLLWSQWTMGWIETANQQYDCLRPLVAAHIILAGCVPTFHWFCPHALFVMSTSLAADILCFWWMSSFSGCF